MSPLRPDEIRERLQADAHLARLDLHERTARLAETEAVGVTRAECARRYRDLLGIDPAQRHDLRRALLEARRGVGASVAAVLEHFRQRAQSNGSVPG